MPVSIITGSTAGIGLETAKGLAKKNHDLILVSRNKKKLESLKKYLENKNKIHCSIFSYDLSLIQNNINLFKVIEKEHKKIDYLINNVGAIFMNRIVTSEGIEKTFALNHMSYFVLSKLFSEKYSNISIINVSSEAHRNIKLNIDDLENANNYYGWHAYKRSKLANIYTTYKINQKQKDNTVRINCLHPGLVNTEFANNNNWYFKFMANIIKYFGISPLEGAMTTLYLASYKETQDFTGLYFDKCKPRSSSKESYDSNTSDSLWNYSEKLMSKFL